jgi:hypothetical protein
MTRKPRHDMLRRYYLGGADVEGGASQEVAAAWARWETGDGRWEAWMEWVIWAAWKHSCLHGSVTRHHAIMIIINDNDNYN